MGNSYKDHTNNALSGEDPISKIASALRALGTGNAVTEMGAIEFLAKEVREGSERIADGLHAIAAAINNHS